MLTKSTTNIIIITFNLILGLVKGKTTITNDFAMVHSVGGRGRDREEVVAGRHNLEMEGSVSEKG